jgi:hypothetical protein
MKFSNKDILKHMASGNAEQIALTRAIQQQGVIPTSLFIYRYVILDIIVDSHEMFILPSDDDVKKSIDHLISKYEVKNPGYLKHAPRNSLIAKRINDMLSPDDSGSLILYPFFPSHLSLPCKPGEHIWVFFESQNDKSIGYWISKIPTYDFVDDVNHQHYPRVDDGTMFPSAREQKAPEYKLRFGADVKTENGVSALDTSYVQTNDEGFYEKIIDSSDASKTHVYERVPRYKKRPGDLAVEGSNNTLIVLGTDRQSVGSDWENTTNRGRAPKKPIGLKKSSGSIDIVAGRGQTEKTSGKVVNTTRLDGTKMHEELAKSDYEISRNEGNPDWKNDNSRIYVAQKTLLDKNLSLDYSNVGIEDDADGNPSVFLKSDKVRIIARKDLVLHVEVGDNEYSSIIMKNNGDIIFKPSSKGVVKIGGEDADKAILCNVAITGNDNSGLVTSSPIIDTMGGSQGSGGSSGTFATKVLIK